MEARGQRFLPVVFGKTARHALGVLGRNPAASLQNLRGTSSHIGLPIVEECQEWFQAAEVSNDDERACGGTPKCLCTVLHCGGQCVSSPRVVPIPVFDIEAYYANVKQNGRFDLPVKKLVCFFVEGLQSNDVVGVLTTCPPMEGPSGTTNDPSSFLRSIVLIR